MADSKRSTDDKTAVKPPGAERGTGERTPDGPATPERRGNAPASVRREAERLVVVTNRTGLHLRPARRFVETASGFESTVHVVCGNQRVNGKSIMELLALAALPDSRLVILADGPDADQAVSVLAELVEKGFG